MWLTGYNWSLPVSSEPCIHSWVWDQKVPGENILGERGLWLLCAGTVAVPYALPPRLCSSITSPETTPQWGKDLSSQSQDWPCPQYWFAQLISCVTWGRLHKLSEAASPTGKWGRAVIVSSSLRGACACISQHDQAFLGCVSWPQGSLWSLSSRRFCKISWRQGQTVFGTHLLVFTQWEPIRGSWRVGRFLREFTCSCIHIYNMHKYIIHFYSTYWPAKPPVKGNSPLKGFSGFKTRKKFFF